MEYLELIRKRYSVRAYKSDPVSEELLAQVLEAGQLAPTAANKQPFRIIVIHTKGREALGRIYHRDWFVQAPLILCVCTVRAEAWKRTMYDGKSHADVDATIVMDHWCSATADLGLGAAGSRPLIRPRRVRCLACRRKSSRCSSRRWASRPTRQNRRNAGRWLSWCATSGGRDPLSQMAKPTPRGIEATQRGPFRSAGNTISSFPASRSWIRRATMSRCFGL